MGRYTWMMFSGFGLAFMVILIMRSLTGSAIVTALPIASARRKPTPLKLALKLVYVTCNYLRRN